MRDLPKPFFGGPCTDCRLGNPTHASTIGQSNDVPDRRIRYNVQVVLGRAGNIILFVGLAFLARLVACEDREPAFLAGPFALEDREQTIRPVDPRAAVEHEGRLVWVLPTKRKSLVLTVAGGATSCRFVVGQADGQRVLTATASFSRAGRPRFAMTLPPGEGVREISATCAEGSGRVSFYVQGSTVSQPAFVEKLEFASKDFTAVVDEARARSRTGEYAESAQLWRQLAESATQQGWKGYDSSSLAMAALMFYRAGLLDDAERLFARAKAMMPSWASLQHGRFHRFYGYLVSERREAPNALALFREAVRRAEVLGGPREVGYEVIGLASELSLQGRDREALEVLEVALEDLRNQRQLSAAVYSNAAVVRAQAHLRRPEMASAGSAREMFEESWRVYGIRKWHHRLPYVSGHGAAFEVALGDLQAAAGWLARLDEKNKPTKMLDRWFRRTVETAVEAAQGRITVQTILQREQDAANALGSSSEASQVLAGLAGRMAWQEGDYASAERALKRSLAVARRRADKLEGPSFLWALTLGTQDTVARLADVLLRTNRADEAWRTVETAFSEAPKWTASLESVGPDSPAWKTFTKERLRLRFAEQQWCSAKSGPAAYACKLQEQTARERLEAATEALYRAAGGRSTPGVSIERIQQALGSGDLLIYGLRGGRMGEAPWYLAVDRSGVVGSWRGTAQLLAGAAALKAAGRVFVVGSVPMNDLVSSTPPEVRWSRLSFGAELLRRQPERTGMNAVTLDPDGSLLTLRRPTRQTHAGASVQWLVGQEATQEAVRAVLSTAVGFHFVGHGLLGGVGPLTTYIRLHDGTLTREDVLRLSSVPRVVILEGCETGPVDGLSGLPQAFVARGAWAVLATQRVLRSGEGSDFIRRFVRADGWRRPGYAFRRAIKESQAAGYDAYSAFVLWGPLSPSASDSSPR